MLPALIPLTFLASVSANAYPFQYSTTCMNPQPLSCHLSSNVSTSSGVDTCCSAQPGGLQLITQFWDTAGAASKLPQNSWTVHGLWPDNCGFIAYNDEKDAHIIGNGSYNSYCDASRNYSATDITNLLIDLGQEDLIREMNTFWINQGAPNSDFWAHEFAKHATCTSTFDTRCYRNYINGTEVVDFFQTTLAYYKLRSTYSILAQGGVVPSNSTNYTLAQLQNAVRNATGATAYFGCGYASQNATRRTVLQEVWYYGYSYGRVQDLRFSPTNAETFGNSSCPTTGIQYPQRAAGTEVNPLTGQYVA